MRGLVLVGVLGLTGCHVVFGLERHELPDDERDAAIDMAGPGDPPTDGGVAPGTCWSPTAVVRDEDGDTVLDHCDNCPARANLDQRDDDRDGVGDVCDPHPVLAIEKLVYFDGFNALPPGESFAGIWSYNGSSGINQSNSGLLALYVLMSPRYRRPTVDLQYTNGNPQLGATEWQFGGMLVNDPIAAMDTKPDGLRCSELIYSASTDEVLIDRLTGGMNVATGRNLISGGTLPRIARMSYDRTTGDGTCTIDRGSVTSTSTLARVPGDGDRVGIGLYTRLAAVTFQNVTVYETIWPPE